MTGYIYCAENDHMPGLVKIGLTLTSPEQRMAELSSSTGVPGSFICMWYMHSSNPSGDEARLHKALHEYRLSKKREFFRCTPETALSAANSMGMGHAITPTREVVDSGEYTLGTSNSEWLGSFTFGLVTIFVFGICWNIFEVFLLYSAAIALVAGFIAMFIVLMQPDEETRRILKASDKIIKNVDYIQKRDEKQYHRLAVRSENEKKLRELLEKTKIFRHADRERHNLYMRIKAYVSIPRNVGFLKNEEIDIILKLFPCSNITDDQFLELEELIKDINNRIIKGGRRI